MRILAASTQSCGTSCFANVVRMGVKIVSAHTVPSTFHRRRRHQLGKLANVSPENTQFE